MLVVITQPEFMPWLSFFDKMDLADRFVLLDNVQFRKRYFFSRCKIRDGRGGSQFFTVPLKDSPRESRINEKEICVGDRLIEKALRTLEMMYDRTPHFREHFPALKTIIERSTRLSSLNQELVNYLAAAFGINTEVLVASELDITTGEGGTRVVGDISKHVGATHYLSGKMGTEYLDESYFDRLGIQVSYHDYEFVPYPQAGEKVFIAGLSAADLLFNCGSAGLDIIRQGRKYDKASLSR